MTLKKLRHDALIIFQAGLSAVDPARCIARHLDRRDNLLEIENHLYNLSNYQNIYVIGAGKAAAAMGKALEMLLGGYLTAGIINTKYGHALPLKTIKIHEAGHPVPDVSGLRGTQEIVRLLQLTGEKDLIFCLLSGGGSALLPLPVEGVTLEEKQEMTRMLLECGATIHEINALRKHLSRVKGGRLARLACPSPLISLILSDVIGDDLDVIASGPTAPDRSTYRDCLKILDKYNLQNRVPPSILNLLSKGARGEIEETPKVGDPAFKRTQNVIIGRNLDAVEAAKQKACELGYHTLILSTFVQGETREIARMHAALAREILSSGHPVPKPACLISGGETTVTLRGSGLGGRNQEFALAAAMKIDGLRDVLILSGGTDGTDGPTEAAGALADGTTLRRASKIGLDALRYLRENNSYHFFRPLGDLLITGPTRTNVMDLRLVLVA